MKKYLLLVTLLVVALVGITIAQTQEEKSILEHLASHQENIQAQIFEYGQTGEIQIDEDIFKFVSGDIVVNTSSVHEGSVVLVLLDIELEREYEYSFPYQVKDTVLPVLQGVQDLNIVLGDPDRPNITASDPVDGALTVTYDKDVDYGQVGSTDVSVSAVDQHGNTVTNTFTVTIKPKPQTSKPKAVPKQTPSVPKQTPSSTQPRSSVRFDQTGETIKFAHAGIAGGMAHIDTYTNQATTWEVIGNKIHSNTDGIPTYFAGHVSNAFKSLPKLKMGSTITVVDHTGHTQKYQLYEGFTVDIEPSGLGNGTIVPKDPNAWDRIYDMDDVEGIILQTCTPSNPNASIYIVQAKPI